MSESCQGIRTQFYKDLEENYLAYLLNYNQEKDSAVIETQRVNPLPYDQPLFSSKLLLSRCFTHATLKLRVHLKPHTIDELFRVPRTKLAAWRPIRSQVCYYHPNDNLPIIYRCDQCW